MVKVLFGFPRGKVRMSHVCLCVVTTLFGCGRAPEPAAQQAALSAPSEVVTPASHVAIDRALTAFSDERGRDDDPDARWALRLRRFQEAQATLRRGSVDDSGLMASLGELRRAFMASAETQADYEAHEAARIQRGERIELTDEDRENARRIASYGEMERVMSARRSQVRAARADDIARSAAYVDTQSTQGIDLAEIVRTSAARMEPVNTGGVRDDTEVRHAY